MGNKYKLTKRKYTYKIVANQFNWEIFDATGGSIFVWSVGKSEIFIHCSNVFYYVMYYTI